jgi:hypothetical protein
MNERATVKHKPVEGTITADVLHSLPMHKS